MEQLGGPGEVLYIGSSGHNRVDQTGGIFDSDMEFDLKIPLVALIGLVHLGIMLPLGPG